MNVSSLPEMENFFMALADKTRLRILNLMREGEVCVCFFTEVLGESQPKISRHLAYLRSAGIVGTRRDGKWINYRIINLADDYAAQILDRTLDWLDSQREMRMDYERLLEIYRKSGVSTPFIQTLKSNILPQPYISKESPELETFLL